MNVIDEQTKKFTKIFGESTIPAVNPNTLLKYYSFLTKHIPLPFMAILNGKNIKVFHLSPVNSVDDIDEHYGLICEAKRGEETVCIPLAEIDVKENGKNYQLIDDYQNWFWENR